MIEIGINLNRIERDVLYEGLEMNKKIALVGLRKEYRLQLGKHLSDLFQKGVLSDNLIMRNRKMAAAPSEARMGGANMPVMSTAGSVNEGITSAEA